MRLLKPRAFARAGFDEQANPVELSARVDRADIGVFVERIAHAQSADAIAQFADDGGEDRFLYEKPRTGTAHVPLIEVDALNDAFNRLVERRIVENDICS